MAEQQQVPGQIQVKFMDEDLKGRYSNMVQVSHKKEEFLLDFFNIFPPAGILVSRIILSPGHLKRMIKALEDNLHRHEDQFGKIEPAEELQSGIGF